MNTLNRKAPYLAILGFAIAGWLWVSPAARATDMQARSSVNVNQLLSQVKTEARVLDNDSDQLASYARSMRSPSQSHAGALNQIKDHVNKAGQLLAQLDEARATASPWQREAIDRIHSVLQDLADNTQAMMNQLNDNKAGVRFSTYSQCANTGAALAEELSNIVRDYVDFGDHEAALQKLQLKLDRSAI